MPTSQADGSTVRPDTLLDVNDLAVGYGASTVVEHVNVTVGRAELVAVIGPNGSGKSTLMKGLTGRAKVFAGRVLLDDEDVTAMRGDRVARRGLGFVPQTKDVFGTLSVLENLQMGGYLLNNKAVDERVEAVYELFPALKPMATRTASRLSGGERKMLAMGRVLMLSPKLLLLDEPTAGLSPDLARHLLHEQVPNLVASGVSILLVEQKALDALRIADYAYVLVAGHVQLEGTGGALLARPDIREVFLGSAAHDDAAPETPALP
ncbi:MAG TPA: ABC transporter ATP-binding protein [Acidimicrobiales bacterium]|nr:ABC transporter ATP-binding protein [Acidimicrobiales bacterium]